VIFAGGGANDTISGTRTFNTGIAARGRIYIAGDNKVYAFTVPTGPTPTPGPTASPTATPTATPVVTPSPTPVVTPTATPVATPSPTPVITPTATPGITPTATPIVTPTGTPVTTPTPGPATPTPTPGGTTTPTPTPAPTAAQPLNLSTRMRVQTGDNVGIGGFIVTGSAPKHILLRAIGPSLASSIPDALVDTLLELHGPTGFATIANDNWRDDPDQAAAIKATGIPPTNNLEAAIDTTLNPGAYTAIISGKNNTMGAGLIEVYDLSQAVPARLANISTVTERF
jgi:hypothetical protein